MAATAEVARAPGSTVTVSSAGEAKARPVSITSAEPSRRGTSGRSRRSRPSHQPGPSGRAVVSRANPQKAMPRPASGWETISWTSPGRATNRSPAATGCASPSTVNVPEPAYARHTSWKEWVWGVLRQTAGE